MRSCRSWSPNASSTRPDDEACSGSRPAMRVTFEPERGPLRRSRNSASSCSRIASCVCSRTRACTRSIAASRPGAAAARATSGSRAPRGACRCACAGRRRARAGRRRPARRRSGARVEAGRPARRPISAAVCTVRVGVKVSSTRTIRSVTESPEVEFAMLDPDTTPIGWECSCARHPERRSMAGAPPIHVEGDADDLCSNLIAPTRRRSRPPSCSSRPQPHPRALLASPDQLSQAEITQEIIDCHADADAPRGGGRAAGATTLHDFRRTAPASCGIRRRTRSWSTPRRSSCGRRRSGSGMSPRSSRPDAAAHRRAAGRADDGAGPPARLVGSSAREPAHRAVAGERRGALHPPARPASRPARPELHRRGPRRHERQRRIQVHDDQARAPTRGRTT